MATVATEITKPNTVGRLAVATNCSHKNKYKMTVEKKLEKKIQVEVKKIGGLAIKIWCLSFSGLPDRLVLLNGHVWFVELKSTGRKPTPLQLRAHGLLRRLGFDVFVIDSEDKLKKFIKLIHGNL